MKEVDELTAHQQNGTPHRLRGEQFIEYIKTLLKDIETISASFIENTEKKISQSPNLLTGKEKVTIEYLAHAHNFVRDKLKIEMLKVIIDPSEIAKERVAKEFPEGLEYDKFIAKRRVELGDKLGEALKSREADNLRKLGLDPEEIILRGFMTEEEKDTASRIFIDKTRKNPLGYIAVILVLIGLIWLLIQS